MTVDEWVAQQGPVTPLRPRAAPDGAASASGAPEPRTRTGPVPLHRGLQRILRHPGLAVSVAFVLLVLGWAVAPQLFTSWNPIHPDLLKRFQPPGLAHPFGTDDLGRDVWARTVYGAASSLASSAFAVILAFVSGTVLGTIAGFLRGVVDDVIMRVMDVILAIPAIMLSLAIITALGFGTVNVAIAVGFASTATFARVMRAEALTVSTSQYVEAARASGVRWHTVLRRHVLPNALGPVLALAALEFGTAVLAISALSFLGFGAPPPQPEWGSIISDGRNYLSIAWWLTTLPGLVIVFLVLAANRISRAFEQEGAKR